MEQGRIFSTGPGSPRMLTLEDFSETFTRALAAAGDGPPKERSSTVSPRGDHSLNPGMTVPEKIRPAAVLVPVAFASSPVCRTLRTAGTIADRTTET